MLQLHRNFVRTMAHKITNDKKSLSNKLVKQLKAEKLSVTAVKTEIWDIEDLPNVTGSPTSRYFSPVQTRRQRQVNALPKSNIPAKKARPSEDSKPSNIEIGQATVIKCEVVPELEKPKPIKIEESEEIKTEQSFPNESWMEHLENIRLMRNLHPAPVDTMGCDKCADEKADEKTKRFHILMSLMLSSQTKDEITFEAMKRLTAQAPTPASILAVPVADLERLLHPVGFYKNKAKYLKQTSQILLDKYDSDIPPNVQELLKLPGVGPKMAHICMAAAWKQITGIGVDTHVHRIANRLAWLSKPTKEPEQTRVQLEKWLPRHLWSEVNHLLVGFGQTICKPVKPNCAHCLNMNICPASTLAKKNSEVPTKK